MTPPRPVRLADRFVALALLGAACSDEIYHPPIVWEGESVRFGTDADAATLCAGTLPYLDAVTTHLGATFGVRDPHVDFYWFPEGLDEICGEHTLGCTIDGEAFGEHVPMQHEIVHALRDKTAYRALEEGLAELYGDDWDPRVALKGDPAVLWETYGKGRHMEGGWYPLAGHFVSFLRAAYGEKKLFALLDVSRLDDSWGKTQSRFEEVYGLPIADAFAAWEDYPACDQTWYRDNQFDCDQEAVVLPSELEPALEIEASLDCADPDVLGPRRGERWRTITVEVPADGSYEFGVQKVGGTKPGRLRGRKCGQRCGGGKPFESDVAVQPDPESDHNLFQILTCIPAGRYTYRFAVDDDDEGEFVLRFNRLGGASGCF